MATQVPVGISARDLSRVDPFRLGPLHVDPPTRTIANGAIRKSLEPRVMQVLVALGLEPGQVLSRDDLIALCWDGRIVGDNAINRVISLLRQAVAELAGDAVRLETITKVGFRLVVEGSPAAEAPPQFRHHAPLGRRKLLAGGALLAAAAGTGGWTVLRHRGHTPDPRAVALLHQADALMKSGRQGTTRQAVRYLEQAVEIDPDYADGWGLLASGYRHRIDGFSQGERQSYPRMLRSAARRALELDPDQPDARLALVLMQPFFGRWGEAERGLRAVQGESPRHWYANAQISLLLMDVGRADEALGFRATSLRSDPEIAVSQGYLALNEVMSERYHQGDRTIERAMARWPAHPFLWMVRYRTLVETGRPAEAAAFGRDARHLPEGFAAAETAIWAGIAEAIAGADRAAKRTARDALLATMQAPDDGSEAIPLLALLGEPELALEAAAAYFFGGSFAGLRWPTPDRYSRRPTAMLFFPSMLALRDRPRFASLLSETGLEHYWKQSGSQPDFRRG